MRPARADDQIFAPAGGQPIFIAELDGPLGTIGDAFGAKQATAHIELQTALVVGNGIRRTGIDAFLAAGGALRIVEYRQPAKSIGHGRRLPVGIGQRAMLLPQSLGDNLEHESTFGAR